MKTNLKEQKAITLIALIITIVVLLILAVVTINAVNEGSIFAHANNAATRYSQEAERENSIIANMLKMIEGENEGGNPGEEPGENPGENPINPNPETPTTWTYNSETGKYEKGDKSYAVGDTITNADVLEALEIENSTGTYSGTWSVLGLTNDNKLKLVSTENVGTCTLGYQDEVANSAKTEEEYSEMTDADKMERGLASYQRAVQTLNEAAQTATGITSAESIDLQDIYDIIGEENVDKTTNNANYGKIYNYYYDVAAGKVKSKYSTDGGTTWSTPGTTGYASQTFVNANGEKIVVDSAGDEITLTYDGFTYTLTADQKTAIGSLATGTYWLSSPCVYCSSGYARFYVRDMSSGYLNAYYLFNSGGGGNGYSMRSPRRNFNLRYKIEDKKIIMLKEFRKSKLF